LESFVSLQDVANLVVFVVPGYFAIRTYAIVYAKADKDFSRLLIESIACSLPIVSIYNVLCNLCTGHNPDTVVNSVYVLLLLVLAIVFGLIAAYVRRQGWAKRLATRLRLPNPEEDFIRLQFRKLTKDDVLTVTLRNGEVFSGMPQGGSAYKPGEPRQYYFNNVGWYNKGNHKWEYRPGSLIIDMSDIEYLETARQLPAD
jgi:hypothetical protein